MLFKPQKSFNLIKSKNDTTLRILDLKTKTTSPETCKLKDGVRLINPP